jgi:predicted enzyme related to lactoylglutathione lyase
MTVMNFSALTFQSPEPARLAEFYRRELGVPFELHRHGTLAEHFECDWNGVHFAVLPASLAPGGPITPVFRVKNLEASTADLRAKGVEALLEPFAIGEGMRVAVFADPDRNAFRLVEISEPPAV